ncbi:hypothetical protein CEXT_788861 [Caerostris extrusa]|uniref:Uncharacterized protein n=1 Tax=Caerostris extrusa TaxID=172846 RepID=A0AAV4WW90_CAEEX|nr:hypothetical protein CEXT_788861 [Caerostris extrusa]
MSAGCIGNYFGPFSVLPASVALPIRTLTFSGFGKGRCGFKADAFVTKMSPRRRARLITFSVICPEDILCGRICDKVLMIRRRTRLITFAVMCAEDFLWQVRGTLADGGLGQEERSQTHLP